MGKKCYYIVSIPKQYFSLIRKVLSVFKNINSGERQVMLPNWVLFMNKTFWHKVFILNTCSMYFHQKWVIIRHWLWMRLVRECSTYGNALFLKQYMYKRAVLFHLVALEIPLLHFLVSSSTFTVMFDIKYLVSQFQYFQNVYSILQL